jgi:hypothetical protein
MSRVDELERIERGPRPGEKLPGLVAEFNVECERNSAETLRCAKEVLLAALREDDPGGLALEAWRKILPPWFTMKFSPEITMEEAVRRRALPMEERMHLAETWSLAAWVHWLKPSERQWEWWDAEVISPRSLHVKVVVSGLPFPSGSLQWLFKCCGATSFELTG